MISELKFVVLGAFFVSPFAFGAIQTDAKTPRSELAKGNIEDVITGVEMVEGSPLVYVGLKSGKTLSFSGEDLVTGRALTSAIGKKIQIKLSLDSRISILVYQ